MADAADATGGVTGTLTVTWDGRDRRALGAVALQFAVNGALFASFVPRLPEIRDTIGGSTDSVGLLLSVASVAGLVGSVTVTRVVRRAGTRCTIAVSGAAVAIFLAAVGLSSVWPLMLLGLAGMAVFDVYVDVAMNLQGSWLSARRHRPVMNRLHGLWSLGAVAGGLVASGVAGAGVSLRIHLLVAAVVLLVLALGLSTQLLPADEVPAAGDGDRVPPNSTPGDGTGPLATGATPTPHPLGPAGFFVAGFSAVVVEVAATGWAAFRLTDDFGATAGVGAIAFVAVTAGMMAGRFAGDSVAHRVGSGRLLWGSGVTAGVGLALATLVPGPTLSIIGFTAAGLGAATMLPKLYDDAAQIPGPPGRALGALTGGIRTAALAVPATVGALASTALSVGAAIAVTAIPAAVGFLAVTRPLTRPVPQVL